MARWMKSAERRTVANQKLPPLEHGDCLDQKTICARYEAMPEHVRTELMGGIVLTALPQKLSPRLDLGDVSSTAQ